MHKGTLITLFACLLLITSASAVPTTGAATLIGSNNVTIPITGVTGADCWVVWGYNPEGMIFVSGNATATAGTASGYIWGAPMMGNTIYYAQAVDFTGGGNVVSFTTAAITPIPTSSFGTGFKNITDSHFQPMFLVPAIFLAYFNIIPATIFFGILFGMVTLGIWRRTKSVRMVSVLMIIISPLIMTASSGMNFGVPVVFQALGQALMACGVAGMLLSLVKK
jgi:hypothetical protein